MQSKPEDSMGGHMHGRHMKNMGGNMQDMSHDMVMPAMKDVSPTQQHKGH